ncbi:putative DNA-binding protein [Criibacterium bergeronii]|uniref:putative DNA-binding protein n=1 Tax=Criibacterium bergeronii TaxID=1871336 RepID=UPI000828AB81|nr:putative DNA-binding protein [Criibacterium bergeronii]
MDITRVFEMNELLDIYGGLLTEKQISIMNLYYQEDLSLAEISEMMDISRQAVYDSIKKSEKQLSNYDEVLHFKELTENTEKIKERLEEFLDSDTTNLNETQLSQLNDILKLFEKGD